MVNDFSKEIAKALREYTNEVTEGLEVSKKEVAKETVKQLKRTSPKGDYKGGGDYAKGWGTSKQGSTIIVHNKTDYQLTHLLEKGHVIANGTGRTRKFPHIGPAEEEAIRELIYRMEKVIRG